VFLQNVFIGMDIPIYDNNRRTASEYDIFNNGKGDDLFTFDEEDDDVEVCIFSCLNYGISKVVLVTNRFFLCM